MRVFIGIKFDETTRQDFETFLRPFKRIHSPIKWVKPEHIHLTLKFIGDVTLDKYRNIESALMEKDFGTEALSLNFSGCGTFCKGNLLNIIWLGIESNSQLDNLYFHLEDILQKTGVAREKRPFKPHITVGRNKRDFNAAQILAQVEKKADQPVSSIRANSFQIFKSELFSTGPVYTVQKEITLGNA